MRSLLPRLLASLLCFFCVQIDAAQARDGSTCDWDGDLKLLRQRLVAGHPNLFFHLSRDAFEGELARLAQEAPKLDNSEVGFRLQELIVRLGDDHTQVNCDALQGKLEYLPLELGCFSDGWYVLRTTKEYRQLLGRKVLAVGGVAMPEVLSKIGALISQNQATIKTRAAGMLMFVPALRHVGVMGSAASLNLTTEAEEGRTQDVEIGIFEGPQSALRQMETFKPERIPFGHIYKNGITALELMEKQRMVFFQYNRCMGREVLELMGESKEAAARLPSLEETLDKAAAKIAGYFKDGKADRLIIDLRFNSGGSSLYGTRFAEKLAQIPGIKEPGRVFILIGPRTFSSAILNAMDFESQLGGLFVGEPTSGTRNHYGETKNFTLPSSGIKVTHSTKYFVRAKGGLNPIEPTLPASMSFAQYRAGKDPAISAILQQVKKTANPSE